MDIALRLFVLFGNIAVFTILILFMNREVFCFLVSFSISLFSALNFHCSCLWLNLLLGFNFYFVYSFDDTANKSFFFFFPPACSLLIKRKTTDFCTLILYPAV